MSLNGFYDILLAGGVKDLLNKAIYSPDLVTFDA
jgi:hypothetical protein